MQQEIRQKQELSRVEETVRQMGFKLAPAERTNLNGMSTAERMLCLKILQKVSGLESGYGEVTCRIEVRNRQPERIVWINTEESEKLGWQCNPK
jgi:hypothetical protein